MGLSRLFDQWLVAPLQVVLKGTTAIHIFSSSGKFLYVFSPAWSLTPSALVNLEEVKKEMHSFKTAAILRGVMLSFLIVLRLEHWGGGGGGTKH